MGAAVAMEAEGKAPRRGIPPLDEPLPPPLRRGGRTWTDDQGREWTIPSFSMGMIHGPALHVFSGLMRTMLMLADSKVPEVLVTRELTKSTVDLCKMALDRNYPSLELTFDEVADIITVENAVPFLKAIYDLNGFCMEVLRRLGIAPVQTTPMTEAPGKTG